MNSGQCGSCRAPIIWVITAKGNRQPLNAKSEKRVVVTYDPAAGVNRATVLDTYVPHAATCPVIRGIRAARARR